MILMRHAVTTSGVGDPPGMRLDDCASEVKPQPRAFRVFDRFRRAIKAVEDVRQVLRFDTRSLIAHADDHLLRAHLSGNPYFPRRRVLNGI